MFLVVIETIGQSVCVLCIDTLAAGASEPAWQTETLARDGITAGAVMTLADLLAADTPPTTWTLCTHKHAHTQ